MVINLQRNLPEDLTDTVEDLQLGLYESFVAYSPGRLAVSNMYTFFLLWLLTLHSAGFFAEEEFRNTRDELLFPCTYPKYLPLQFWSFPATATRMTYVAWLCRHTAASTIHTKYQQNKYACYFTHTIFIHWTSSIFLQVKVSILFSLQYDSFYHG